MVSHLQFLQKWKLLYELHISKIPSRFNTQTTPGLWLIQEGNNSKDNTLILFLSPDLRESSQDQLKKGKFVK